MATTTPRPPTRTASASRDGWSFLRHAGLAQPGEVSGLDQGADLRHAPISGNGSIGLHTRDARIAAVAAQPAGFGEFGRGPFGLAFESIGGGEIGVRHSRKGTARLF